MRHPKISIIFPRSLSPQVTNVIKKSGVEPLRREHLGRLAHIRIII